MMIEMNVISVNMSVSLLLKSVIVISKCVRLCSMLVSKAVCLELSILPLSVCYGKDLPRLCWLFLLTVLKLLQFYDHFNEYKLEHTKLEY